MKIIDLLNKIANGEEVPNKIKEICSDGYKEEYKLNNDNWYITLDETTTMNIFRKERLNDEVEILEEEKKIPEKLFGEPRHIYNENELYIVGKINEIIDYLDYLKSKGDDDD